MRNGDASVLGAHIQLPFGERRKERHMDNKRVSMEHDAVESMQANLTGAEPAIAVSYT